MNVKLISHSWPAPELSSIVESPESLIAYCARVSNPDNQDNKATYKKLLNYMLRNKHFSPFEMVHVCMEITTTRDIGRQILRHRSFSFQEYSGRYAKMNCDNSLREARTQDPKNRQASNVTDDTGLREHWSQLQQQVIDIAYKNYDQALKAGIAKEQARALLPEGLTESVLYMSGTLRSWIHWIDVRTAEGVQKEHKAIAEAAKTIIINIFPFLEGYYNDGN
jgi:thymidylate synthase (FAD)